MTVYWPNGSLVRPYMTSDFNPARLNPVTHIVQPHNGIDLIGWTDNMSPVDGTVVFAGYNGGAGNEVRIRADGPTAFHVGDYYRILHNAWLYVSTGQRVSARQPVGRMGTTGQSTGIHCHFETHEWRLWNPVNPTDYMNRANAGGAPAGGESEDDMFSDDDRKRLKSVASGIASLKKAAARLELAAARNTGSFYKHGDMPKGSSLWFYVLPSGDFVRIRDLATARLYKERNGGNMSTTLSGEAIRALRDDLIDAGGRDLSAVPETIDVVETPADETEIPVADDADAGE